MPSHWTYESVEPLAELEQGDILAPVEPLRRVLAFVHPHFKAEKYLGYIVTTQSCDLVRRRGIPKASYINIAVIRPLSQVLTKVLSEIANPVAPGAFRTSAKAEARRMLERIFNQNEQSVGLFFLYPDENAGIEEPAVAFLRVSIALRVEHYDVLRTARVGRLTPDFRAKFGWLIGNLYVRPATPDWADSKDGKKRFEQLIRQYVGEARWIDDEVVDSAQRHGVDIASSSLDELETFRPPSRMELAIQEVQDQYKNIAPDTAEETVRKLGNRLRNSGKFAKLFRT